MKLSKRVWCFFNQKRDLHNIVIKLKIVLNPFFDYTKHESQLRECKEINQGTSGDRSSSVSCQLCLSCIQNFKYFDLQSSRNDICEYLQWSDCRVSCFVLADQTARRKNVKPFNRNFFQSICILGYSIFPLCIVAILIALLTLPGIVEVVIVVSTILWSSVGRTFNLGTIKYINALVPSNKRALCFYPMLLYYCFLGWFIVLAG